jgi:hypothetical protein
MSVAVIHAWKPTSDGQHLTPCDPSEPEATQFEIKYAGAFCGMPLRVESKYWAEQICHALIRCHEAGKEAKLAELRKFLGV